MKIATLLRALHCFDNGPHGAGYYVNLFLRSGTILTGAIHRPDEHGVRIDVAGFNDTTLADTHPTFVSLEDIDAIALVTT